MTLAEHHRALYEYEKDCDLKTFAMLGSVPEAGRADARFQQAFTLAGHLLACRENWLDWMDGDGGEPVDLSEARCDLGELQRRFAAVHARWADYLGRLDEGALAAEFEFGCSNGDRYRLPIEVQIVQLMEHACYHRGQVALLVDQLGGETVDTDYADWWWADRESKR